MLKKDLIEQAQNDCDSQMKGTALEHYSGWSGMTTLIQKDFVVKRSCPAKYSLTDSGYALAFSLYESKQNHRSSSDDENFGSNIMEKCDALQKSKDVRSPIKYPNKDKSSSSKPSTSNIYFFHLV